MLTKTWLIDNKIPTVGFDVEKEDFQRQTLGILLILQLLQNV